LVNETIQPEEKAMTRIRDVAFACVAAAVLVAGLSACQKEGPAERAGKEIDKTVEKAGQQIEKAGEKIQDAAKSVTK
jgi:predicted small secreted protein